MKKFLLIILVISVFGCATQTEKTSAGDSMNGISTNGIEDTTVSPRPDGYAPPNTEIDTSENRKDSIEKHSKQ